jgi:hypothetical protein
VIEKRDCSSHHFNASQYLQFLDDSIHMCGAQSENISQDGLVRGKFKYSTRRPFNRLKPFIGF